VKTSEYKSKAWQNQARAQKYVAATSSTKDLAYFMVERYLDRLAAEVPAGARVLDIGCGTGVVTLALLERGFEVTGVDISAEMLEQLRARLGKFKPQLLQGDVFDLPVPNDSFDAIVSRWVLPHFPQWPLSVMEAATKLRPGGVLLFDMCSEPNRALSGPLPPAFGYDLDGDRDARGFYATVGLGQLRQNADAAGLELVDVSPLGFFRKNAAIAGALGQDGLLEYERELERAFADPGAGAFLRWFEANVSPHLPLEMATELVVTMRRPEKDDGARRLVRRVRSLLRPGRA
jgi:protein-L-isoaspartate O-methyltransferase